MPDVKRNIKITTEQRVIPGADSGVAGFPLRHWNITISVIHQDTKQEVPADCFSEVTYHLHDSFGDKQKQTFKKPPFRVSEDGWGEFELSLTLVDFSGKAHSLTHDLNFQTTKYEIKHVINFRGVKPGSPLLEKLRSSGTVPGDANGEKKRTGDVGASGAPKKKKGGDGKGVDMDLLADGLQKLEEDDLLQVVQMVHDNKSEDSWMRNDVEQGEFHVDLYTLPDNLIQMLWTFTKEKGVQVGA